MDTAVEADSLWQSDFEPVKLILNLLGYQKSILL